MADDKDENIAPMINPEELNTLINKLFKELVANNQGVLGAAQPFSYGLNIRVDGSGITVSNAVHGGVPQQQLPKAKERTPLVDVIDRPGEFIIIAELPGADQKSIAVSADSASVTIAASGKQDFSKSVSLESGIDPKRAKARYNNGVLEVVLKKSDAYSGGQVKIIVK